MTVGREKPLTPAERRRRNRDEMIAAILDTSREVMREHGVAALNLQEVARRLGIRAPSLYEYFDSKAALYDALFRVGVGLWAEYVDALLAREFGSPWDLLRAMFEAYIEFGDDHPEMYKLIHERHVPGFEPSDESLAESVNLTKQGIEALLLWTKKGMMSSSLSPDDAFDLVIVVMHGLAGAHVADDPGNRAPTARFHRLIPAAVALFEASWTPSDPGRRGRSRATRLTN
jgi:AcrR family transcriptional regulator